MPSKRRDAKDAPSPKTIWIIDGQQWPRALIRAELIERGFAVIGHTKLHTALSWLRRPSTSRPAMIILELQDQPVSEKLLVDLAATGIPVVLLAPAIPADERISKGYRWTAVIKRPFTIGAVADRVEEVLRGL